MPLKRVRIATGNPGKLREFRELLAPLGIEVLSMEDLGKIEIIEDGESEEGGEDSAEDSADSADGDSKDGDDNE